MTSDEPRDTYGRSSGEPRNQTATARRTSSSRLLSGLVLDRGLSPRARLNSNHVRQLAEAMRAGAKLPPIVVERKTSRVVDGFHRVEAHRRVHGPEALVEAQERDYADKGEFFLDAVRLNAAHGYRLAPYDHLRCVAVAEELSIDPRRVAGALSVRPSYVGDLQARRMGTELTTRGPIPLKRTIEHMRGRALTPAQIEINQKLGGQSQQYYINQINLLVENGLLDLENPRVTEGLVRLLENLRNLRTLDLVTKHR